MLKKNLLLTLVLFLGTILSSPPTGRAQWVLQSGVMDQQIRRGIDLVYNMEFQAADRIFDSVVTDNPEHPAGHFYKAMVFFWRAVTNPDNTTYDDEYRNHLQASLDRADRLLEKNEQDIAGIFYKGAALGMRARIFVIRPKWSDAVSLILDDAKEGIKYLNKIEEIIPSNGDVLFGRGLYNFYVEAVKDDYPALKPIINFFASGNKVVGLHMLEKAARSATYAKTEAQYELMKIYYLYETPSVVVAGDNVPRKHHERAHAFAQYLANKYPNNVQFLHYLGYSAVSLGLTQRYDSVYRVVLQRSRERREGYTIRQAREAMFFIGQAQLYLPEGNLDSALYYLYNSSVLTNKMTKEDTWWQTKAELLMGQAYDARGDRKNAEMMYRRVLKLQDFASAHSQAERYLETPYRR